MPVDMKYLGTPVTDWTERELRHAQKYAREHPGVINASLVPMIDLHIKNIDSNRRLVDERVKSVKRERKFLLSFVDTKTKPAQSIDVRSVKHAVTDATTDKKGGSAITFAGLVYGYDWLCSHPEILGPLKKLPTVVWLALVVGGVGWWAIILAANLNDKYNKEYKQDA